MATAKETSGKTPPIEDVWSRSAPKYRVRAIVLMVVNILLFCGLGAFAFWLRSGQYFSPFIDGYWQEWFATLKPAGDMHVTLSSFLTFPISIYEVPMQIVVLGLTLAALVSIPIMIAILYRFPACIPFLLVVSFIAMMPWLALTLAGSCILASVKPFRFNFRFASAMMGLLLVVIYFISSSRQPADAVQFMTSPADQIKFVLPWVLAIISSCAVFAIVLLLARAVNYRPGAIAPLLAGLFLTPVILFEYSVGRDELHYRILEARYGPNSAFFAELDVSGDFEEALRTAWIDRRIHGAREISWDALNAQVEFQWLNNLDKKDEALRCRTLFANYREEASSAAEEFIHLFPTSPYIPNAMYILGRALDMRVDLPEFKSKRIIRFYDSFPSDASRRYWLKIAKNFPDASIGAAAMLRLARIDARQGDIDQATQWLKGLIETFGSDSYADSQPAEDAEIAFFERRPVDSTLKIPVATTVFEARRLLAMIEANRDPLHGYAPLTGPTSDSSDGRFAFGLMDLDPHGLSYVDNLKELIKRYPHSQLEDNIELAIALTEKDMNARILLLESCIQRFPNGDAIAEALYRLGVEYQVSGRPAEARKSFDRLNSNYPDCLWAPDARERLLQLPVDVQTP